MRALLATGVIAAAFMATAPAAYAGWSKSYVIDWQEPAFYNGGSAGETDPGTDCPLGANPDNDWRKMLKTSWRTDDDVTLIMNPEQPSRQRDGGYRGPSPDINVYSQPWTLPDPGIFEVSGKLAYGFDLDGDKDNGFTSVDGKRTGIDNQFYKIHGCNMWYRGPTKKGNMSMYGNDRMREGSFTLLIVLSGEGADADNDENVKMGFYVGKDKLVKDQNNEIASGYTFRINPDPKTQSVIDVRTFKGVIETRTPQKIQVRGVPLEKGQLRFEPQPDGSLVGFTGGYRTTKSLYDELNGGGTLEIITHTNIPAMWYAIQRAADANPDKNGNNQWISAAYRYYARPAHVVTPDADAVVTVARLYSGAVDARMGGRPPRGN